MDDSVSDPRDQDRSLPAPAGDVGADAHGSSEEGPGDSSSAQILSASKFGAASGTVDAYAGQAPWVGKIFLSYSSPDRTQTNGIRKLLQGMGHTVFHDHESISAGSKWRTYLATALEQSDCIALFWTKHARKSDWVREEYETFARMKPENPLIPIYGDRKVPLPPLLSEHHVVDLGYQTDEKPDGKRPGVGVLGLGRGAAQLASQINGSIDTALGVADKLRKAGKGGAAILQGVVSALKTEGYPVPHPELLEDGLKTLGGLGWRARFLSDPLEPVKKPARWAKEKAQQAAPGAIAGGAVGAAAAVLAGVLMAPVVQSGICGPLRAASAPPFVVAGCPVDSDDQPIDPGDDPAPAPDGPTNNFYRTSSRNALPYAFDREFRALRVRADLMIDLMRGLTLGTDDGGTTVGWPNWPTPTAVADWSVLLTTWEQDETVRRGALASILEANQSQTDSIIQALSDIRTGRPGEPADLSVILTALLEGLDNQHSMEARLMAVQTHLERLSIEVAGPTGATRTILNTGLGNLIVNIQNQLERGDSVIIVPAGRHDVHYFLLPYSTGLIPRGTPDSQSGLDEALTSVQTDQGDSELELTAAQFRVLLLPYLSGAVSVLGIEGSELESVILALHRFLVSAEGVFESEISGREARLLILPYEMTPLPPDLDLSSVQSVLNDLSVQMGLSSPEAGQEPARDDAGASPGSRVTLRVTRDQAQALIIPHILASPARLMEAVGPTPGGPEVGGDLLDLDPSIALHDRTYDSLLALSRRTSTSPTSDWSGELAVLAAGQGRMEEDLATLLARVHALERPGSSSITVATSDGPTRIRYLRPAGPGIFEAPREVSTDPPDYPAAARADSLHGVVDVEAMILVDGAVNVLGTAAQGGLGPLERAAEETVATWRFEAGRLNDVPIEVPLRVSLLFELGPPAGPANDR